MIYSGKTLGVDMLPSGTAHLVFDLDGSSVNKFNKAALLELQEAVAALQTSGARGVIFSSAKSSFIVGADITEFTAIFQQSEQEISQWLVEANKIFSAIEDLPMPTVTAINGIALGGGFEMALATDYRVVDQVATVGFPEVKLGILPGFGGTVRLPRLIGADNANQWISSGAHIPADQAFKEGAVDAVVATELLQSAAEKIIEQCVAGKLDYRQTRQEKLVPLTLQPIELNVAFETAKGLVAAKAGPNYPAPVTAVDVMQRAATLDRAGALEMEHKGFVRLAKTEVAANLVQMFLNDQYLAGKAKQHLQGARSVQKAAVLGAGIMGGGIAYQSALKGTPIIMKDVMQNGLDLGSGEIRKLLEKRVSRGKLDGSKMIDVLSSITPTLEYEGFGKVDFVVEAVVENPKIKKSVLAEVEAQVAEGTILASNTSTISITSLAENLKRPENFCGMHFFNPVHKMPLVEVIRGEKTSEKAIAATVAYAKKMGKTPVVVNDCPGFLVNRILFPYFGGFMSLIEHGADFQRVDKVMEKFGWPMGPAYLLDVVGMDTAEHANGVMAAGFPDRMSREGETALSVMYGAKRLGQKNKLGFYAYEEDRKGRSKKVVDETAYELLKPLVQDHRELTDETIIERMMIPLCIETVRCLEDGIVETASEADMGLIFGIGFPPFRGGALRYIDSIGLEAFCAMADTHAEELGALYQPTEKMRAMAAEGKTFF